MTIQNRRESDMTVAIREAIYPDDYAGLARIFNTVHPKWRPATAGALERQDARRDPAHHWAVFVAEDTGSDSGRLIGTASAGHEPQAHRPGRFKLSIRVLPDQQGRGVGSRLYRTLLDHLEPLGPRELHAVVGADQARGVRFCTDRGFVEAWPRIESTLDVAGFDFAPHAGLKERVTALGLTVQTYADLGTDPKRLEKLYDLDWLLYQDVPFGDSVTQIPLEQFEAEFVGDAGFLPEACFIALKEDQFVGYSNLTQGQGYYMTAMTGVLPEYRGRGLATWLKLLGIRYAQSHGNLEIRAVNDSPNRAMLALNAKLGFKRRGAAIRFVKKVDEAL